MRVSSGMSALAKEDVDADSEEGILYNHKATRPSEKSSTETSTSSFSSKI